MKWQVKEALKQNLKNHFENKDTKIFPTISADTFNKKFIIFTTNVEGAATQELREYIKFIKIVKEKLFAFPSNITEVFITGVIMKNTNAAGFDNVSDEKVKPSPSVIFVL